MKATDSASVQVGGSSGAGRRAREILRSVILYSLLIGGSAIFSLPFIYMIGTSFKMDREMGKKGVHLLPESPQVATASPYVDPEHYPMERPDVFASVEPVLRAELERRPSPYPAEVSADTASREALVRGVFHRLWQVLPRETWQRPVDALPDALRPRITDDMVSDVARNTLRVCTLGAVRARSVDLQEKDLTGEIPPAEFWTVESGPGTLQPKPGNPDREAVLGYDFSAPGSQEIRLSRTLELPFPVDRLARVQIALQPDDSWHEFQFHLEMNGQRFDALRPQHLGGFQPMVVTLQEEGPADKPDSLKLKLWIPYRGMEKNAAYTNGDHALKLVATLKENNLREAWAHKAGRNYLRTLDYIPIWRYAATSIVLVILNILGNVFSCSLAAYAFARLQWPGRNLSFGLMLATMMIPPQITMIPFFLIIKWLGWYNSLTPLWLISFFGNAFNIFLLRQFMKGIPRDLEDAARMDGCNFMQVYWHVIMPLIKPTLACIAVFTFVGVWNDFMGPLIFLADQRLYPLSLGLYAFQVQEGGNTGMMMAASLLMTLPVIAIFFFAQRYFIQGITLSGMKG